MLKNNDAPPRLVLISMDEHLKREPGLIKRLGSVLDPFEDDIRRGVELGVTQKEIKRWLSLNGVEVGRTTVTWWLKARNITRRRSKYNASKMSAETNENPQPNGFKNKPSNPQPEAQKPPEGDVDKATEGLTPWDPKRPKKVDFSKFHPK